jgi:hypothetical protein
LDRPGATDTAAGAVVCKGTAAPTVTLKEARAPRASNTVTVDVPLATPVTVNTVPVADTVTAAGLLLLTS